MHLYNDFIDILTLLRDEIKYINCSVPTQHGITANEKL